MAKLHGQLNWPWLDSFEGLAGLSLAGRHSTGIWIFWNLLDSDIIGRQHPLQLRQMDSITRTSCVWRETINFTAQWRFGTASCRSGWILCAWDYRRPAGPQLGFLMGKLLR
ncbi:hypothetical protein AVEN_159840-1 [Araneus ventricosus]|uniref:Uncharacterized protein n=1 Tax=Araneus ventricosus TaxID=182803 RepID=A0A4Y2T4W1_ARAVE|nr:hypothetical protein AVEN_159840-1 [Araneus ventricosus]